MRPRVLLLCLVLLAPCGAPRAVASEPACKILFLGDQGHHQPAERYKQLAPVLSSRGIVLAYTEDLGVLEPAHLAAFDGLLIYANIEAITPQAEQALLDYVASGGGLIAVHCASYCFLNSPAYVDLVGAQFQRHETGIFRTEIAQPEHPLMQGFHGFESWDETYVHTRHNDRQRVVLEFRVEGEHREPWTWVRSHGAGRVFYTAWGHDERTWSHFGFHNLIERGVRWSTGGDPGVVSPYNDQVPMSEPGGADSDFAYRPARLPFYPAGERWGTIGEPISEMQQPLAAEQSQQHFSVPAGFEVQLFASEPEIGKPIAMNWDERGRLWICESVDYPNELQPPGEGRDRIRICEDTNGDGRADKFTVFAENLSIPTSLVIAGGGVIVHQAPETLLLRDTNGDDVADERRALLSGWLTNDTHAGPSNLHYGLDNWIWGIVGYAGFEGTVAGEPVSFRTGFYRFRPDGSQLEFLRNTNNNSWGLGFSEEGIVFGSTANGNPSEYLPIPNRYYEQVRGWSSSVLSGIAGNPQFRPITEKIRQVDHHGGYTAAAGHAIYTARTYPREYWNRVAFVTEPTGHLVSTFMLQSAGANFRSRTDGNLLASRDEWSAPIMAEVGPDGHVWVIDWYNMIVQHNPTPAGYRTGKGNAYETDLRDKTHGRIYRVVYSAAPAESPMSLAGAAPNQLVAALRHPNMFWRKQAQRLLVERAEMDVVPQLVRLVDDPTTDAVGLNPGAIHALWTLHGLGALAEDRGPAAAAARRALQHESMGVRRAALAVLPPTAATISAMESNASCSDVHGQVRLAALLALAEMDPAAEAAELVGQMSARRENLYDRWLPDALIAAGARHDQHVLPRLLQGMPADWNELSASERETWQRIVATIAEHYARGGPQTLAGLIEKLPAAMLPASEAVIAGLSRGWPATQVPALSDAAQQALATLLPTLSAGAQSQLVALAERWESDALETYANQIVAKLLAVIEDEAESNAARRTAAIQLVQLRSRDPGVVERILDVAVSPRTDPELASMLLEAVRRNEATETADVLIELYSSFTPALRSTALAVLLGRAEWTGKLMDALDKGVVPLGDLTLDQKQSLATHPDSSLAQRAAELLERGGSLPDPDRAKVLAELMPLAAQEGDPVQGKLVFEKQCSKCHMHSGQGNRVGPDLTGMAVHPKAELLTQILDPSRSVEGNYRMYTVALADGRVLQGLLASETKTSLEMFDTEGKKQILLRDDVEQLVASPKSLMPEGFEKQVTQEDLVNLLAFLTRRGRFLPLPLAKVATIVSTRGMFYDEQSTAERLVFPDWDPKTVQGVPFQLVDPQGDRMPNVVLLYGPQGKYPPTMPKSVSLSCNAPARTIHLLSGVSGWGFPNGEKGSVSMIVRLHYQDGTQEDIELRNGEHFADYIRVVDVPLSHLAFDLEGRQVRYLALQPQKTETIQRIELVKGPDTTAPLVVAVTVETPSQDPGH